MLLAYRMFIYVTRIYGETCKRLLLLKITGCFFFHLTDKKRCRRCSQFLLHFINVTVAASGSSVGVATAYGLDGPGIESLWWARFSAPVHTGPEDHPASCTMGTGSFPGVSCGRGVTLNPHPLLVPRSKI